MNNTDYSILPNKRVYTSIWECRVCPKFLYILGFGIELMTEIARYLQFNVTFKLVDDGKYGSINEHGRWNGMIKEVRILPR